MKKRSAPLLLTVGHYHPAHFVFVIVLHFLEGVVISFLVYLTATILVLKLFHGVALL